MSERCDHCNRWLATDRDVRQYFLRVACVERGACECKVCEPICWTNVPRMCNREPIEIDA